MADSSWKIRLITGRSRLVVRQVTELKLKLSGLMCRVDRYLVSWSLGDSSCHYSSADCYNRLSDPGIVCKFSSSLLGRKNVPPKIKYFIWLSLKDRISTKDLLFKRGILVDVICSLCHSGIDSIDHLFGSVG